MDKPKLIISSAYAAIVTIVFVTVITVLAELSAPLKDWLKNFSGHHWTSKSIFSVLLYAIVTVVLYLALRKYRDGHIRNALVFLLVFTALGTAVITLFFTGHHFQVF